MIIKAKRSMGKQGVSHNQLYFVIKYKEIIKSGEKIFYIFDDCRTLSWENAEYFSVETCSLDNYKKEISDDTVCYTYKNLDDNFFSDFYLENDVSEKAVIKLENTMVDVIAEELTAKDILKNIDDIGLNGESVEYQLKSFFKICSNEDVRNLVSILGNYSPEIYAYLFEIIVTSIISYKGTEIDTLLSEIFSCPLCSEKLRDIISDYWM